MRVRRKKTNNGEVGDLVVRARRTLITTRLILSLLVWLGLCFGMWLTLFVLDNFLHFPAGLRLAMLLVGVGLMVFLLWRDLLVPVFRRRTMNATVLLLEKKYAVPGNLLINALQFEDRDIPEPQQPIHRNSSNILSVSEQPFARQTISTGLSLMARMPTKELWPIKRIVRWLVVFLMVGGLWAFYGVDRQRHAANALTRFLHPLADVPPAGSVRLKVTPDRDIALAEGGNLRVSVEVKAYDTNLLGRNLATAAEGYPEIVWAEGTDYIRSERDKSSSATIPAEDREHGIYSYTFTGVKRSFAFRVYAADTYSRSVRVTVNAAPRIKESLFYVLPPAYTGSGRVSIPGPPGAVSGLAQSRIEVEVKLDKRAERLWWKESNDTTIDFEYEAPVWRTVTTLNQAGPYQVLVKGRGIDRHIRIAEGTITLQRDRPPEIDFVTLERSRKVDPGDILKLDLEASDDFGISEIFATVRPARDGRAAEQANETVKPVKQWNYDDPPGRKEPFSETLLVAIDPQVFQPGNSYVLEAFCKDFSPAGHIGKSQPLLLQVRSLEELTISADDPASRAFAELEAAILEQQAALGITRNVTANLDDILAEDKKETENREALRKHSGRMEERQQRVGRHLNRAWELSVEPRPEFVHKMIALRDGEQAQVTKKIRVLKWAKQAEQNAKSATLHSLGSIERLQDFILGRLIALKGRFAGQKRIEAEKATAEILGENIDDVFASPLEDVLENMVGELDDFVTRQKTIMGKRNMIMDQPPEDFSEDDQDSLESLALDQSKLAEILDRVVNDLTNMNLLDFGDSSLVESMKSIYQQAQELSEAALEAAEQRQARVDAHRLETETVEMAEELMINCEAVLGFYDSIQFVAEIPEDEQLVAPLAELPYELEDLVGDLITSEEEMRQEVEDIGSYLTSLDHTAGPVSDGTISSTSAKGLTGDQKPEDNVIQGRSGAGRSGMSDGQLVEPVAKDLHDNEYGLRERLSYTPLEGGQVKDEDADAQTGGTGLGKTTDGASPFGMGGQLPPRVLEMMKAAVLKQQVIRQSAQDLAGKLKHYNLPGEEMTTSIRTMRKVEEAIQGYDGVGIRSTYNETLNALKKSQQEVGRQIAIQNRSRNIPRKKMDHLLSQKQLMRFRGYEQMISAYFEALAQDGEGNKSNP